MSEGAGGGGAGASPAGAPPARRPAALPRWAAPYLPRFQEILHALSLTDDFVLMPIEVPSAEVARALAAWLTAEGRPCEVIEPASEEAWRGLAAALLAANRQAGGAVMVIGPHDEPSGMSWGLSLLNQRRDSAGKHLGCPLLWCGPWAFLDATWRAAPDFWSVGDVPKRIEAPQRQPPPYPMEWAPARLGEPYLRIDNHVWYMLNSGAQSEPAGGYPLLLSMQAFKRTPRTLITGKGALLEAELYACSGEPSRAEGCCVEAIRIFREASDEIGEAHSRRALGHIRLRIGRELQAEAEQPYQQSLALFRRFTMRRGEAHVLRGLGDLRLMSDRLAEARRHYDQALTLYRASGDRLGEGNAQRSLGDFFLLLERLDDAERAYREAARLYAEIGALFGQRVAEEGLARVARERAAAPEPS